MPPWARDRLQGIVSSDLAEMERNWTLVEVVSQYLPFSPCVDRDHARTSLWTILPSLNWPQTAISAG